MEHVLDNPAWNALLSGNANLAKGNNRVKYFNREVSPFFGLKENSAVNFQELHELIGHNNAMLFVTPVQIEIPAQWKTLRLIQGLQMVYNGPQVLAVTQAGIVPLTNEHIPQMLALTKLTNPGPFAERTIDFGHYYGIFNGDKLVAMAGQRMHIFEYAEVSAVCTHPDYTGKGYSTQLLLHQVNRIKSAGSVPILHVRFDNERAIKVYERLGFATRTDVYFSVLQKTAS